jgi:hypothetical protein
MLGGLIDRRTTHRHLLELEKHDLVKQVDKRWLAREPEGEIARHFAQTKACGNDGRWHGCFASWKLPLPKSQAIPESTELDRTVRGLLVVAQPVADGRAVQQGAGSRHSSA